MGKKSKGPSIQPMKDAIDRATALQRQVYEETIERGQPWYQTGVAANARLSDLLGISGGSQQTRSQVYDSLLPQFQTESFSGTPGMYIDPSTGTSITAREAVSMLPDTGRARTVDDIRAEAEMAGTDFDSYLKQYGFNPAGQTTTSTDYDALNAAVDAQLAGQSTPGDFGFLTERFGEAQFRADPGYQFRQEEGSKALERRLAAQGKRFSPEAVKALTEYNQGLADQAYQDAYNRYTSDQANIFNRLYGVSGMGQQQTSQFAQAGQQMASNVGDLGIQLANAQVAADAERRRSRGSMFSNLVRTGLGLAAGPLGGAIGSGVGTLFGLGGAGAAATAPLGGMSIGLGTARGRSLLG